MSFVAATVEQFQAPATLSRPFQAPGVAQCTWRYLGMPESRPVRAWLGRAENAASAGAWLAEVLIAWDVVDRAGDTLPTTADSLDRFFDDFPDAAGELCAAYFAALREAREKNLSGPSSTLPPAPAPTSSASAPCADLASPLPAPASKSLPPTAPSQA